MAEPPRPARNASSSVRRALALLEAVRVAGADGGGLALTRLAQLVGCDKSTVLRLAAPLLEADLLTRDRETGLFRLGPAALSLGQAYLDQLDLRSAAAQRLRALMRATGHTCHLVVLEGREVVYVDKVENEATVRMGSRIGARMPAYRTAVGKAILAFSGADVVEEVIAGGMPAVTPKTITDPGVFRAELARVRERGYAIDDRENEPEVRCVSAPIFRHDGAVAAAVSVSALASRLPAARVRDLGPAVAQAARDITVSLGGR
ncbi:IclR family transcriptional regulator [Allonocardiopsis opalescens]|uniref:IclR family transcriptional regulator n=1 Tax=Allonocardiopsis opalescens TaxID=1144618 RepID=A0A2T0QAI1_9ACTN|nr:IclR family transcriptional regulator [Allonocardiopsis opalescens]PRY00864.1 IclR family transcriptional regulator [Allonocardiopsis opalescens]